MIPGRVMFLLQNFEPELAKLVAELERLQSQGKWDAGLTIHLGRLAKLVAARKPPLNEGRDDIDWIIRDMEDIVCSLLREQSDKA